MHNKTNAQYALWGVVFNGKSLPTVWGNLFMHISKGELHNAQGIMHNT